MTPAETILSRARTVGVLLLPSSCGSHIAVTGRADRTLLRDVARHQKALCILLRGILHLAKQANLGEFDNASLPELNAALLVLTANPFDSRCRSAITKLVQQSRSINHR